jgi:hypothetical protein
LAQSHFEIWQSTNARNKRSTLEVAPDLPQFHLSRHARGARPLAPTCFSEAGGGTPKAPWQRNLSVSHIKVGDVLLAQLDLGGAEVAYRASLQIRERLAGAAPSNAEWQRGLWVSCLKIADALEKSEDASSMDFWRRAHEILSGMKRRRLFVSGQDEQFLASLQRKLG